MKRPDETPNDERRARDFVRFLEVEERAPPKALDALVLRRVRHELRPSQGRVWAKMAAIEAMTGVGTLFVCPQFELGFGSHNRLLHTLHSTLPPLGFQLFCGALFVLFGALASGLLLRKAELRAIGGGKPLYALLFALSALTVFVLLGAQLAVVGGLAWLAGAWTANVVGLHVAGRARFAFR